jgi:hypothetical protein
MIQFAMSLIALLAVFDSCVTREACARIKPGMTWQQVESILGKCTTYYGDAGHGLTMCSWLLREDGGQERPTFNRFYVLYDHTGTVHKAFPDWIPRL